MSYYWSEGDALHIDLLPSQDMSTELKLAKEQSPESMMRTVLQKSLMRKLVAEFERRRWPELAEKPLADWPDKNY